MCEISVAGIKAIRSGQEKFSGLSKKGGDEVHKENDSDDDQDKGPGKHVSVCVCVRESLCVCV